MTAEYQSLLSKGAIEEVADTVVEILPGRGVPTEKPGNPPKEV